MPAEYGVRIRMGTLCVLLAQLFGGSEVVRIDLHVLTAEHEKDGVGQNFILSGCCAGTLIFYWRLEMILDACRLDAEFERLSQGRGSQVGLSTFPKGF